MGNKIKCNLKNVHAAKMTETDQEGTHSFSYETPQTIPGAVSISLDADGIVYFRSVMNNGYSGDLEISETVAYIMAYHANNSIPTTIPVRIP